MLRTDPNTFKKKLEDHIEETKKYLVKYKHDLNKYEDGQKALKNAQISLNSIRDMALPKVSYSHGLSNCARDLVCEIGAFSFIAPINTQEKGINNSLSVNYLFKYGIPGKEVSENICYKEVNPIIILCKILSGEEEKLCGRKDLLLNPNFRIVGVAYGKHNSFQHCVCIIYSNSFSEVKFQ